MTNDMDGQPPEVVRIEDIVLTFKGGRYAAAVGVGARYFMNMMIEAGEPLDAPSDPETTERLLRSGWLKAALEAFPDDDPAVVTADIDSLFDEIAPDVPKPVVS